MPIGRHPEALREPIARLRECFARAGRGAPEIVVLTALPIKEPERAVDEAAAYAEVGATQLVHSSRYANSAEFERAVDLIATKIRPAAGAR